MSKRNVPDHPETKHPSTKRAKEIDADTPYEELATLFADQESPKETKTVLHWFRSKDLRIHDNQALHAASTLAKESKAPLICAYVNCPAEFRWHGTSPARTDFICENLGLMQSELEKLDIPLVFLEARERDEIVPTIVNFIRDNDVSHVFANYEYEIDELRRDIGVLKAGPGGSSSKAFRVSFHHDQTVVEPGTMLTDNGKPMKVFTPYHRAWLAQVKSNPSLLDTVPGPSKNPGDVSGGKLKALLDSKSKPPTPPKEKQFKDEAERKRIRSLWPAGHDAAVDRLNRFLSDRIDDYAATRSNPAKDSTSRLSAYFAAGVLSVRETLSAVRKANKGSADFSQAGSGHGTASWVRELVFRELYRQTTLATPHTAMNLPQNLKFDFVRWEDDQEGYDRWEQGTLGVPFVDAGMRQIRHEAYMHNRLRMNVSSYLYCNLLVDYRRGERYFAETLIDWDMNNNTQGWEPSYTVFNPVSQAEKNDPEGAYIRKWVPELKDVQGKAVFDPYHRLSKDEFEKLGYPAPYVDWRETKQRAVERFKSDMKDADP
ncbi:hypothetical protein RBB50_006454 [Rhinocladiella similis]